MAIPVVSIVGRSGSGKTTLISGLISELKRRGYRVGTIKHAAHGFDLDRPGKDTWKYGEAGADTVLISAPQKVALIEKVKEELTFDQAIDKIRNVDIILAEGYKINNKPKIEVFRFAVHKTPLCTREDDLLAVAGDSPLELGAPVFSLNDFKGLTDLIEAGFLT